MFQIESKKTSLQEVTDGWPGVHTDWARKKATARLKGDTAGNAKAAKKPNNTDEKGNKHYNSSEPDHE